MGLEQTEGQANPDSQTGITGEAPGGTGEQLNTGEQTTNGPASTGEEVTFFDPSTLTPELMPAYKQMQAAFTKKNQSFSESQSKIDAYNAFQQNPQGTMQQLAAQYGYQLVTGQQPTGNGEAWEPTSWDEVMDKAKSQVMAEINPELKGMRQKQMERTLDDISPDWRTYEDDMMSILQKHPTLVNDPDQLYRMSVPPELLESRATQAALSKLKDQGQAASLSGGSTTTRTNTATPEVKSFADAVKVAEAQLAANGVRR